MLGLMPTSVKISHEHELEDCEGRVSEILKLL